MSWLSQSSLAEGNRQTSVQNLDRICMHQNSFLSGFFLGIKCVSPATREEDSPTLSSFAHFTFVGAWATQVGLKIAHCDVTKSSNTSSDNKKGQVLDLSSDRPVI